MKQIHFEVNGAEEKMLSDLKGKLNKTVAAVFRDALRLLHKKEITK